MQTVDRNKLKSLLDTDKNLKLVDVLSPGNFNDFHLPGAVNIPISDDNFDERIEKTANKNDTVVVYCKNADCDASTKAAARMEKLGFQNVLDYEAGKDDWRQAGLEIES